MIGQSGGALNSICLVIFNCVYLIAPLHWLVDGLKMKIDVAKRFVLLLGTTTLMMIVHNNFLDEHVNSVGVSHFCFM